MSFFNNIPNPLSGLLNGAGGYLRTSRHATKNFGLLSNVITQNYPRHKFQYFVKINFNTEAKSFVDSFLAADDQSMVFNLIKSVDMPSMNIDTTILNQYNKKRISQTKVNFEPISMSLWDVVDGKSLRLWEMYYMYYFKEGSTYSKLALNTGRGLNKKEFNIDIITEQFNNNYGFNLDRVGNNKYLIESIEIYQVHRAHFSKVELVRPRIESFNHDTLSFDESGGLMEFKLNFVYEDVIYANNNTALNEEELKVFQQSGYLDLTTAIRASTEPKSRNLLQEEPLTGVSSLNPSNIGPLPGLFNGLGNSAANSLVNGAMTGNFSLSPNPISSVRNAANNIVQTARGNATRGFAASAGTLIANVGSSFSSSNSGNNNNSGGQNGPPGG